MRENYRVIQPRGFTLVELIVVVGLIGIFVAFGLALFASARDKAYVARVEADLRSLQSVVVLMEHDTKKWPNGCTPDAPTNPVVDLSSPRAGLRQRPIAGGSGDGCEWTNEDIALWRGPYVSDTIDPWRTSYVLYPSYAPYVNCASQDDLPVRTAVVSFGPNKNPGDCDDLFASIQ